jgi:hypothetical protein
MGCHPILSLGPSATGTRRRTASACGVQSVSVTRPPGTPWSGSPSRKHGRCVWPNIAWKSSSGTSASMIFRFFRPNRSRTRTFWHAVPFCHLSKNQPSGHQAELIAKVLANLAAEMAISSDWLSQRPPRLESMASTLSGRRVKLINGMTSLQVGSAKHSCRSSAGMRSLMVRRKETFPCSPTFPGPKIKIVCAS